MQIPETVADLADKKNSTIKFTTPVSGFKFTSPYSLNQFIKQYANIGFQGTNLFKAIQEIKRMQDAKVFFACTSNIITSGLRDTITFLARNKKFSVFVTTAGGIEEDLIKCFENTLHASFNSDGKELRDSGFNRVGNLVIPNENYAIFEKWLNKIVADLTKNHTSENPLIMTPSKFIKHLGKLINNEDSILYWCYKNDINVYCPALTDGSIGDILTFNSNRECFKLDIVEDIKNINYESLVPEETGVIILGSGIVKHHTLNANLFRNGAEYCVFINNASEFDGSDAGANIDEAVSWGKIKKDNTGVKVFGDATIIFPLIVAGVYFDQD